MSERNTKQLKRIVKVTWTDAVGSGGWRKLKDEDVDDPTSISTCHTVGFLLRSNKKEIVLTASKDDNCNNVDHVQAIPRGMVKKVETLEVADSTPKG